MREPISLKEILAVIVKRGWGILCASVAMAIILGGYKLVGQLSLVRMPENSPVYIEGVYQSAMEAYENSLQDQKAQLEKKETELEEHLQYAQESLLQQMDSNYVYQNVTVYAVTDLIVDDLDEEDETAYNAAYRRVLVDVIQLHKTYWNLADTYSALKEQSIKDIKQQYVRELVEFTPGDDGAITVTVRGKNQKTVDALMTMMETIMQENQNRISENFCQHKVTAISSKTTVGKVDAVAIKHGAYNDKKAALLAEIAQLKQNINEVPVPTRGSSYGMRTAMVTTIKWSVIGAVVGVILSCAWVLVVFLFRSSVESSRQMEQVLGIPFLGSAAKCGGIWKRLADKIMVERVWEDPAQAQEYLIESLRNAGVADGLLVLTTLEEKNKQMELQLVEQAAVAAGAQVLCVAKAEENAQTVTGLQTYQRVILAEGVGKSEVPKMRSLQAMAQRMGAEVVGFVTI